MYYSLLNKTEEQVTTNMEKTEIYTIIFLPQFSMMISLSTSLKPLNLKARIVGMNSL